MALDDGGSEWISLHQVEKILFVAEVDGGNTQWVAVNYNVGFPEQIGKKLRSELIEDGYYSYRTMWKPNLKFGSTILYSLDGGRNTAKTLSELVIHDSKNRASAGFRLSSAIAPARQNQLSSS